MLIEFVCPSGHKLKADGSARGKVASCPKCHVKVKVPTPALIKERNPITDSGVMRILGEMDPVTTSKDEETMLCSKCRARKRPGDAVCENCQLFAQITAYNFQASAHSESPT